MSFRTNSKITLDKGLKASRCTGISPYWNLIPFGDATGPTLPYQKQKPPTKGRLLRLPVITRCRGRIRTSKEWLATVFALVSPSFSTAATGRHVCRFHHPTVLWLTKLQFSCCFVDTNVKHQHIH